MERVRRKLSKGGVDGDPVSDPELGPGVVIKSVEHHLFRIHHFHQKVFRALGFVPTTIDVRDLVSAIKANRVDAQENPLTNIVNFGIHEHQPHITLTGHFFGVALLLCNRERLQSWPADVSAVIRDAAAHATACQRRFASQDDESCLHRIHEAGITPITPSARELQSFQDRLSGLKEEQMAMLPNRISELVRT